jgi:acetyl esterase
MPKPRSDRLLTKIAPPLRRTADRIAGFLDQKVRGEVRIVMDDLQLGGIPARRYKPAHAKPGLILFVHGGGWLMGGPRAHGSLMHRMAQAFDRTILSLDYGLAPEVPVDVAFEQVCAALLELSAQGPSSIVLMGESAGAMMIAHAAQHHPETVSGLVLVCPILDFTRTTPDLPQQGAVARLVKTVVNILWPLWSDLSKETRLKLSPLAQPVPAQHPPTLLIGGNADPLKMDVLAYAKKLTDSNIDVTVKIYPRVTHGFFSVGRVSQAGRDAVDIIGTWIDARVMDTQ